MTSADLARAGFIKEFGLEPIGVWSAPGRVNLIGEHTDYNEGFVLPFAINRRTFAAVSPRQDNLARVCSSFANEVIEIPIAEITSESVKGWAAYPLGVAWAIGAAGKSQNGFDLYVESNVPVGAGLSSSAAIEISVATALNDIWASCLEKRELAKIGQRAENEIVGAPTGIMDQTASLFGLVDHAVFLDCRSLVVEQVPLQLEQNGLEIVVIDTKVSHRLVDGGYASRRAACEEGANKLQVASLRDLSEEDLERAEQTLDPIVFRRIRHVITENARVLKTVEKLKNSGPTSIGMELLASHASMRDDFEISIDELNLAVDVAMNSGAIGARMTGGGFGGAAIALIDSKKVSGLTDTVLKAFADSGFAEPAIFSVRADGGAKREI